MMTIEIKRKGINATPEATMPILMQCCNSNLAEKIALDWNKPIGSSNNEKLL